MKALTGVGLQANELLLAPPTEAFLADMLSAQLW